MARTIYTKMIGDRQVFSYCKTLIINGVPVSNPTAEMIASDGWQIYVPPVVPPQPQTEPGFDEIIQAVKKMLSTDADELTDEEALEVAAAFKTWESAVKEGKEVPVGKRLWYDGKLWKVIIAHVPMENWTPDTAVSLFVEVSIEEFPAWHQPLGSEDSYQQGDKVSHNDKHWISDVDGNVWEPGVYGWTEIPQ